MSACIESNRKRTPNGYLRDGHEMWHRKIMRVHHVPLAGLDVRHLCGNRWCENFEHLTVGTRADNMRDALKHGTVSNGERHVRAKVTEDDVIEIRRRRNAGETLTSIAVDYEVNMTAIHKIATGFHWKHVA